MVEACRFHITTLSSTLRTMRFVPLRTIVSRKGDDSVTNLIHCSLVDFFKQNSTRFFQAKFDKFTRLYSLVDFFKQNSTRFLLSKIRQVHKAYSLVDFFKQNSTSSQGL